MNRDQAGWHVELYIDTRTLADIAPTVRRLPAVCIATPWTGIASRAPRDGALAMRPGMGSAPVTARSTP